MICLAQVSQCAIERHQRMSDTNTIQYISLQSQTVKIIFLSYLQKRQKYTQNVKLLLETTLESNNLSHRAFILPLEGNTFFSTINVVFLYLLLPYLSSSPSILLYSIPCFFFFSFGVSFVYTNT